MTQFATDIPAPPTDYDQPTRALATDSLIAANRAKTPPQVVQQRAVPRMSIADINGANMDELKQRFSTAPTPDSRGPFTRFFDLLDLPRNTLANIAFPSIAEEKVKQGETGSLGMGVVRASDVLKSLGVHNHAAAGILGFIGDVATDPLTYLGGAGFASKIGRGATITKEGLSAISEGVEAIRAGRSVADPLVAQAIKDSGSKTAEEVSQNFLGHTGKGKSWLKKLTGDATIAPGESEQGGSQFARDVFGSPADAATPEEASRIASHQALYAKYGRHAAPGIRIGPDAAGRWGVEFGPYVPGQSQIMAGTGVAHIPFTDYGIYAGQGMTGTNSQLGVAAGMAAQAGKFAGKSADAVGDVNRVWQQVQHQDLNPIIGNAETLHSALGGLNQQEQELYDVHKSLTGGRDTGLPVQQDASEQLARVEGGLADIRRKRTAIAEAHAANVEQARQVATDAQQTAMKFQQPGVGDAATILHVNSQLEAANHAYDYARAAADGAAYDLPGLKELHTKFAKPMEAMVNDRVAAQKAAAEAAGFVHDDAADMNARLFHANQVRHEFADALQSAGKTHEASVARMSPEELDAASKAVDLLQTKQQAAHGIQQALRGTLYQTANGTDKLAAALSNHLLRNGPEDVGQPMMVGLNHVLNSILTDRSVGVEANGQLADLISNADHAKSIGRNAASDLDKTILGARSKLSSLQSGMYRMFGIKTGRMNATANELARASTLATNEVSDEIQSRIMADLTQGVGGNKTLLPDATRAFTLLSEMPDSLPAVPDKAWSWLQSMAKSGVLDQNVNPGVYDALKEVVGKWRGHISAMTEREKALGITRSPLEGNYFPHVPTMEAARDMRTAEGVAQGGDVGAMKASRESFQKPRSMVEYKWTNPDGQERSFLEGNRILGAYGENDLKAMSPMAAAHITEQQGLLKELSALESAGKAPEGKYLSIAEINERARNGNFRFLFGGPLKGSFMEENGAVALGRRFALSHRAELTQQFLRAVENVGIPMDHLEINNARKYADGMVFQTGTGAQGRMERAADGAMSMWIGYQKYRKINMPKGVSEEMYNPLADIYKTNQKVLDQWLPEKVATMVEEHAKSFVDPTQIEKALRAFDSYTKYWKVATLSHPSWMMVNVLGHGMLAFTTGLAPHELAENLKDAWRVTGAQRRGDAEALDAMKIKLGDRVVNGSDLVRHPVQGGSMAAETLAKPLTDGTYLPPRVYSLLSKDMLTDPMGNIKNVVGEMKDRAKQIANAASQSGSLSQTKAAQRFRMVKAAALDEGVMRYWSSWVGMDMRMADTARTAAMMGLVKKGYTLEEAAAKIGTNMLDMATMTRSEKNIRSFIPFYSWMRNSGQFGLSQLLDNPKFFTLAPHTKAAVEEAVNGDGNLPEHMRPQWVRDEMGLQIGSDPDTRTFLTLANMMPQDAAVQMANGMGSPVLGVAAAQSFLHYFANSLNPALKAALEIGSGKEWFTGKTISADPNQGDMTPGEYLANQIRPYKELVGGGVRKSPVAAAFAQGPAQGIERLTLGGRAQPFNEDRRMFNLRREFDDQMAGITKRINLDEREGDKEASLKARVALLQLISDAQKKGLQVPKALGAQASVLSAGT